MYFFSVFVFVFCLCFAELLLLQKGLGLGLIFQFHNLPCVSFRWWSSIPLGEGGALFSIEGASNEVTINAACVFYYWGLYDTSIVISYKAKSSASFEHR